MRCAIVLFILAVISGCSEPEERSSGHEHAAAQPFALHSGQSQRFAAPQGVKQIAMMLQGSVQQLESRVLLPTGWSPWRPVEITWSSGDRHVARAFFDGGEQLELRAPQSVEGVLEIYPDVQADRSRTLTRDLVPVKAPTVYGQRQLALAPPELVISRAQWGAQDPERICNDVADIYRITVHHTAGNVDQSPEDGARVVQQIQAFHIDGRGWCDIGYHFIVSQHGNIYQGRYDERRPAAHVTNQNSGNVGISLIGNFEETEVPAAQFAAAARILAWNAQTYGVALEHASPNDRGGVRGHQEWPTAATACPGRNLLRRLDELIALAISDGWNDTPVDPDAAVPHPDAGVSQDAATPPADASQPGPDAAEPMTESGVTLRAAWVGLEDAQATRRGTVDVALGEPLAVDLLLKNTSNHSIGGVRLGYALPVDLRATDYTIYTDAPSFDGRSWQINDANDAPENPNGDALGRGGELTLYAFAAGETKRVRIEFTPQRPTAHEARPATVQTWVANIDSLYAQDSFSAAPSRNALGGAPLTASAGVDVQSVDYWRFDNADDDQAEGWTSCGGAFPILDRADGALTMAGPTGCTRSPLWTAVDADAWDQLVLQVDHSAEDYVISVSWKGTGSGFDTAQALHFFAAAGTQTYVLPLSDATGWSGEVDGLRVEFGPGAIAPFDLRALWFQSSVSGRLSDPEGRFAQQAPIDFTERPDDRPDPVDDTDGGTPNPRRDAGVGSDGGSPDVDGVGSSGDSGCEATDAPVFWWMLLLPIGLLRRRQRMI